VRACRRGHNFDETVERICLECRRIKARSPEGRAKARKYENEHADKRLSYKRKYYTANPSQTLERNRRWRDANIDSARKAQREAYRANPEKTREAAREYYRANTIKAREKVREWRKAHPLKKRQYEASRKARSRCNPIERFSESDWMQVVEFYGGCCAYCGITKWEQMDHVVPLASGGRHALTNLVPACAHCNQKKHTATWEPRMRHPLMESAA
jgi:5-methylcytosine-specific restriction endonuclease McrA